MRRDSKFLDQVARRLVHDVEEDLRSFLRLDRLDPQLVALLYLQVRGVIERCGDADAIDELALAIYLTASAWQSSPEPPVDFLTAVHSVISRTLASESTNESTKGTAMKIMSGIVLLFLLNAATPVSAEDGAALFRAKCAMCHGPDGAGATAMGKKLGLKPLGSSEVQKKTDAELTAVITSGKGKMPAFGEKLTADQVKALVAHIRTLGS